MKVSDHNSPIQLDAYVRQAQQQQQKPKTDDTQKSVQGSPSGADKVELSNQARQAQQAAQQVNQATAGHEDKVRQVQMDVEKGNYRVDSSKVASDMLKESFENDIILQKVNTRA